MSSYLRRQIAANLVALAWLALFGCGVASHEGPTGALTTHSVLLTWDASTSTVIGYNVYRGTQSGGPYVRINTVLEPSRTFTDTEVQSGLVYFYVVTAVGADNSESSYSSEVSAVIPTP